MANTNPLHPYWLVIYTSSDFSNTVAHFQTTFGMTSANLYQMLEIICVFSASFAVHHEMGGPIERDEEALECGRYYIVTQGMCHFSF